MRRRRCGLIAMRGCGGTRRGGARPSTSCEGSNLATRAELSAFLASVERRAFKQALYGLRDEDNALDAVQDAMMKLATRYADRPADELPMLFQRILQNAIHDVRRRLKVRSTWVVLASALTSTRSEDVPDQDALLERLAPEPDSFTQRGPHDQYASGATLAIIEEEVARLPARQREAFLMRYWEEMDIAETAAAMGCSQGSVKTHCSRATHTLAAALRARGVTL